MRVFNVTVVIVQSRHGETFMEAGRRPVGDTHGLRVAVNVPPMWPQPPNLPSMESQLLLDGRLTLAEKIWGVR